jgi:hypothetical protein
MPQWYLRQANRFGHGYPLPVKAPTRSIAQVGEAGSHKSLSVSLGCLPLLDTNDA